jgi:hypothetical protein
LLLIANLVVDRRVCRSAIASGAFAPDGHARPPPGPKTLAARAAVVERKFIFELKSAKHGQRQEPCGPVVLKTNLRTIGVDHCLSEYLMTAVARLLEFWVERTAEEEGFGNRVKITDMVTHEAIDVVKRLDLLREFEPPASTTPTKEPAGSFNNCIRGAALTCA